MPNCCACTGRGAFTTRCCTRSNAISTCRKCPRSTREGKRARGSRIAPRAGVLPALPRAGRAPVARLSLFRLPIRVIRVRPSIRSAASLATHANLVAAVSQTLSSFESGNDPIYLFPSLSAYLAKLNRKEIDAVF
ncbi:hypothetical protein BO443_170041 [Burkholderia orbicola]